MEADLEVREQGELRARLRVALEPQALVVHERLSQVTLPLRWIAGTQAVEESADLRRIGRRVRRALVEVARELEPDLLEHPQVPARDGGASSLERVERRVQLGRQAPDSRLGLEEAVAQHPAPQRPNRVQQPAMARETVPEVLEQVLAADGPACLSRGPRRIAAPVRTVAASCHELRCETRVAIGDPEVPDDRVRDRDDLSDLFHARHGQSVDSPDELHRRG